MAMVMMAIMAMTMMIGYWFGASDGEDQGQKATHANLKFSYIARLNLHLVASWGWAGANLAKLVGGWKLD